MVEVKFFHMYKRVVLLIMKSNKDAKARPMQTWNHYTHDSQKPLVKSHAFCSI